MRAAWPLAAAAVVALAAAPRPARAGAHPCHCAPCMDLDCDVLGRCGVPVPEGWACDDGDPCTYDDACDAMGECRGTPHPCRPNTPCRTTFCFPDGGCRQQEYPDDSPCDDNEPCTVEEQCRAGECVGRPRQCRLSSCHRDGGCEPGYGCVYDVLPDGTACDALGQAGACRAGICFQVEDAGAPDGGQGPGTGACGCASSALLVPLAVLLSLAALRRRS